MELEYTVEEGDISAFLDYHTHHSAALQELRRSQMYGYAILLAIFAVTFWLFGETAVAIAFLILGPLWAAWWPSRTRRLAREQSIRALSETPGGRAGEYGLRLQESGLVLRDRSGEHRLPFVTVQHVVTLPEHLFIYLGPAQALIVPRRTAKGDVSRFASELERMRGSFSLPDLLQRQP